MAKNIRLGRWTTEIEGDLVVFIIGAQVHKPWKLHKWVWMAKAMNAMVKELQSRPESGFLGVEASASFMVQYWRSLEHLVEYARSQNELHWPAWVRFNRGLRDNDAVGVFHESFLVRAGAFEAIYTNCKPWGLGKVGAPVKASGPLMTARQRAKTIAYDDAVISDEGEILPGYENN